MTKSIENILDECLNRIINLGEDIEQCLKDYPEAKDLRDIIKTALSTREAASTIEPRPEFKESAKSILLAHVRAVKYEQSRSRRHPFLGWQTRWLTAAVAALLVISLSGSVVTASSKSMPDSLLYPVKIAVEDVRLSLAGSDVGKAKLEAQFIDRRIAEIVKMAEDGQEEKTEKVAQRLMQHLNEIETVSLQYNLDDAAAENDIIALRNTMTGYATDHPLVLEDAVGKAPVATRATISHVLDISQKQYTNVIQNINSRIKKSHKGSSYEKTEVLDGIIRMTAENNWVVGEKVINIDKTTNIDGNPVIGASAHAAVSVQSDGTLVAEEITVNQDIAGTAENKDSPDTSLAQKNAGNNEVKKSDHQGVNSTTRALRGIIRQIYDTKWIVDNRSIIIDSDTVIEVSPEIGLLVEVTVLVQPDGTFLAQKIVSVSDNLAQPGSGKGRK